MKRLIYGMLVIVLLLSAAPALQAEAFDFLSADGGICSAPPVEAAGVLVAVALIPSCTQCKACSSDLQCGGTSQGFCLPTHQIPCPATSTGKACLCR